MEDQNNKKGFDDFFRSKDDRKNDNESRSEEQDRSDSASGYGADTGTGASSDEKASYYYSYGPMSGNGSTSGDSGSRDRDQSVGGQAGYGRSSYTQPSAADASSNGDANGSAYEAAESGPASSAPQQKVYPLHSHSQVNASSPARTGTWKVQEKKRSAFGSMFLSFLSGVLVVGVLMYMADANNWFTKGNTAAVEETKQSGGTQTTIAGATGGNAGSPVLTAGNRPDFSQLFAEASPAVVKIETFAKSQRRSGSSLLDDPFFRQFFGDNYPGLQAPEGENGGQMQQTGIGTGFFFEADGHILTNQHVLGDADEIRVTVQGYDEPFIAEKLGTSFDLDLAVIKIKGDKEFPTLPLGSSDDINIGDWVVAIGNPYGFDHTITVGVLSAKERPIDIQDRDGERNYKHLLQTDASINPGNSGGPLLNAGGEVIGINTAVSSQAQGIGFAIPTSTIFEVLDNLKENKTIPKEPAPFIGAELSNVTEEMAAQLGLEKTDGSIVRSVYYNSPAYLGDLKQFDVIIGVDGKKIANTDALIAEIKTKEVGQEIQVQIIRQGKEATLQITVGDKAAFGIE